MRLLKNSILLILLTGFLGVNAHAEITVSAVQPPAWKESNGNRSALFPGDKLLSSDKIFTGVNSRVLLDFNEGSIVEIGQDTSTTIESAPVTEQITNAQNEIESLTSAAIKIVKGAFRYTAQALTNKRKRDIKITLTTSTIGIRGTDLWGKSSKGEDFVVLIEGDIVINHKSKQQLRLNKELSVYTAPAGSNPNPLSEIKVPVLLKLAKETVLIKEKAVIYPQGRYSVILASSQNEKVASKSTAKLNQQGYPIKNATASVNGKDYTRSKIQGFKSLNQARLFLKQVTDELNINDAWILKES